MQTLLLLGVLCQQPLSRDDFNLFQRPDPRPLAPVAPKVIPQPERPVNRVSVQVRIERPDRAAPRLRPVYSSDVPVWRTICYNNANITVLGYDRSDGDFDYICDQWGRPLYIQQPTPPPMQAVVVVQVVPAPPPQVVVLPAAPTITYVPAAHQ